MSKASKNLRPCLALGHLITAAVCGEGRGSLYDCPQECPFFPFTPANYDRHGEIETRLIRKCYERVRQDWSQGEQDALLRVFDRSDGKADEILSNHAYFAWRFHWRRGADGRTTGERWLADPRSDLSNDERVLLSAMNAMQPAVVEFERIVDDLIVEGTDLLDGRPVRIVDYSNARSAVRYLSLLAWIYPMRHYARISGGASVIPAVANLSADEIVREITRHLGGPSDPAEERGWLAENFTRISQALTAVKLARQADSFALIDATYFKTDYRSRRPYDLAAKISRQADLLGEELTAEEEEVGFLKAATWLTAPDGSETGSSQMSLGLAGAPKIVDAPLILGRLLIGRDRVRIEAMTRARHQDLRARFERIAGRGAVFMSERSDDLAAQQNLAQPGRFDAALVPPRLRENPQIIALVSQQVPSNPDGSAPTGADIFRQQYLSFADVPLAGLDGQTPRAAAANAALRPRLVALMKSHIQAMDLQRRNEGMDVDLNPLLQELGLHELISEPPPLGQAGTKESEDADAGLDDIFSS